MSAKSSLTMAEALRSTQAPVLNLALIGAVRKNTFQPKAHFPINSSHTTHLRLWRQLVHSYVRMGSLFFYGDS